MIALSFVGADTSLLLGDGRDAVPRPRHRPVHAATDDHRAERRTPAARSASPPARRPSSASSAEPSASPSSCRCCSAPWATTSRTRSRVRPRASSRPPRPARSRTPRSTTRCLAGLQNTGSGRRVRVGAGRLLDHRADERRCSRTRSRSASPTRWAWCCSVGGLIMLLAFAILLLMPPIELRTTSASAAARAEHNAAAREAPVEAGSHRAPVGPRSGARPSAAHPGTRSTRRRPALGATVRRTPRGRCRRAGRRLTVARLPRSTRSPDARERLAPRATPRR